MQNTKSPEEIKLEISIIDKLCELDQSKEKIVQTAMFLVGHSKQKQQMKKIVKIWREQIMISSNQSKYIELMFIANDLIQRSVSRGKKDAGKSSYGYEHEFKKVLGGVLRHIVETDPRNEVLMNNLIKLV